MMRGVVRVDWAGEPISDTVAVSDGLTDVKLTYDMPVRRLASSKNRPRNKNAIMCSSGIALPSGELRKSPSFSLAILHLEEGCESPPVRI